MPSATPGKAGDKDMIGLEDLIYMAPYPPDTRQKLLSALDSLSPRKKSELEDLSWMTIAQWYNNEVRSRQEIMTLEMAHGRAHYSREDMQRVPDEVLSELAGKVPGATDKDELVTILQEKLSGPHR
jgi:hypothetical protein